MRPALHVVRPAPSARRRAAYRRRRIAAAVLAAAVLLAARVTFGGLGGGPLTAPEPVSAPPMSPVAQRWHVVEPGDTLWTIARALQPSGDVRALVDRLAAQHRGAVLRPGELVTLP